MSESVNHPPHYNASGMECIEAIEGLGFGRDFCRGNVIKYVVRFEHKNGVEDLKKARRYLDRLIRQEEFNAIVPPSPSIKTDVAI